MNAMDMIAAAKARRVIAAEKLAEAMRWAADAAETLSAYERDLGIEMNPLAEIGRIDESRDLPSFRIRVGHVKRLAAALAEWDAAQ